MIYEKLMQLIEERNILNQQIEDTKKELSEKIFTYKVGDIVPVKGYSHAGKNCKITSIDIIFKSCDQKMDISIRGTILKKDGTDSSFRVDWTSWYDDNLKHELETLIKQ